MKKILTLSLVAVLLFASALCSLSATASKGDNLAAGKPVDVRPHTNGDGTLDGYNTDLTDGKTADTFDWADGSWFSFQINNNTDEAGYGVLVIDLTETATVGQVRVHTLFADGSNGGVGNPRSVQLEFSADKVAWYPQITKEFEPSTAAGWDPQWIEFDVGDVDTRYIRLIFEQTQAFVMIDEVEVLEGEKTSAPEEPSSEEPAESSEAPEPSDEPSEEPSEAAPSDEPSEPTAAVSDETSEATSEASSEATSEATSAASSEEITGAASSVTESSDAAASGEEPSGGNGLLIGILIAVAAIIAVAVAVVLFLRKRKG